MSKGERNGAAQIAGMGLSCKKVIIEKNFTAKKFGKRAF